MAEAVKREYEASLSDLTFNSKPLINMLTMLAEENVKFAPQIVEVIESRLQKAKPSEKLPVLYLMDSIIKNMKGAYLEAFTPNIVLTFCSVFEKVDEKTRQSLFKLRMTWSSYFNPKKLYALDLKVKELDPAWPIVADPTATQPAAIHVNPKFIKKPQADATPKASLSQPSTTAAPAPASTTTTTSVQLTAEELAERKKKESERQEMEMRQQLIKKQEQLLELQRKRLEFELQQTQSKLEEQALELRQKNEQLLIQQQALHQQQSLQQQQTLQQQQQAAAAAAAATWPGVPSQPPLMWPGGPPMMPGHNGPPMSMAHDPSMMAMPQEQPMMPMAQDPLMMPTHNKHRQPTSAYIPPPPVPPLGLVGQQVTPPLQPVLPMQQVPPVQQGPKAAPAVRDPRIARDPRLARRDPRIRGTPEATPAKPVSTAAVAPAVATVPPVQSMAQTPAVASAPSVLPATSNATSQATSVQQLKSVVTVAPSQPSSRPTSKISAKGSPAKDIKATEPKQQAVQKRETKSDSKPDTKASDKKDPKSEAKPKETKAVESKSESLKPRIEVVTKQDKSKDTRSNDRSPRRSSDEKRDYRSDSKSRDSRSSREPERRTSRDSKKDFDKRDSWSSRERDSRERDRDYHDRPKDRVGGSREPSRLMGSRRRSNRSRSRSRSPVSRSRSPRGSDKSRSTSRAAPKVDKFGRDLPRPVKETAEEKKPEPASGARKKEDDSRKKEDDIRKKDTEESYKKDIDERVKSRRGSKENVPDVKEENKLSRGKTEKRRSTPDKETDKEIQIIEEVEAPRKRPRLDGETPDQTQPPEKEPERKERNNQQKEKKTKDDQPGDELLRPRPLMEISTPRLAVEPGAWRKDPLHPHDRPEHGREMLSPPAGRRDRPPSRRRLSIDPNVHIPKELSLEKHAFILEQAEKQLHSGEITHQQHQELLRQLSELHQIQRQQKDEEYMQQHPQDPHFRRHNPDHPKMRPHVGWQEEGGIWPADKDIDHRRSSVQDVDMRVFDPAHPMHVAMSKSRGEDQVMSDAKPRPDEQLKLPSSDQDERTRNLVQKDRDDRVRVPPSEKQKVVPPPLKSILKTAKPLLLDSPMSPEPEEKRGNDAVTKTVVEDTPTKSSLSGKDGKSATVSDDKVTDQNETITSEVIEIKDTDVVGKGKGKKKNKKKKKKGAGSEAEVHVEVSAFEENLEIKPPVFSEKKIQPLMDMDERRNSMDEPAHVLPAPFREADDVQDLFPAGKDLDERQGPGHPRDGPPVMDKIREGHPRDPRLRKGPSEMEPRDITPRPGLLRDGDFPSREAFGDSLPRDHPYMDRHPSQLSRDEAFRERPPREGPFQDGLPRDHPLRGNPREFPYREGQPKEGPLRGAPRDGPFREGPPREGLFRDEFGRERPYRDSHPEGPFRDGPPRDGPFRDGPPRDGPFRDGPFRDGPSREGPLRDGPFRDGPPRDGPFRDGPFRDGPPREGLFRDGPFRDGPPREGPFREGPFRDGPPGEGPFRDGSFREPPRHGPMRDDSYRGGPPREGLPRDDPRREGPFRESPPRDGSFRDGPPRDVSFNRRHPREGPPRGSPPREGSFRDTPPGDEPFRGRVPPGERPFRDGLIREGPPFEGPFRGGPPRDGPPRDASYRRSPPRGDLFREGSQRLLPRDGPPRDPREERYPVPPEEMDSRADFPRFGGPPGIIPRTIDKDERLPQLKDQKSAERIPVSLPMEVHNPPSSEPLLPVPHSGAPHLPSINPALHLRSGLGVPNLGIVPIRGPPTSLMPGTGLPVRVPRPAFFDPRQAGGPMMILPGQQRPMHVPGMQALPQQVPGVGPELEGQRPLDPRGFPQPAPGMPNPAMMGAPHLVQPENPQGTPPPQPAAPLDINSLFAKLVATGILPPTRSDSPVVQGTGTPPPTVPKEEPDPVEPAESENLFVPELGLYPEELKCRYEGVINRIYTGTQCSSCGMRFVIDEMDRYRKHLDWHFRQNRREKDGMKAAQNRKWFYEVDHWLDYEEINEVDEERSNFFESMALKDQTDKDGVYCVAIDAGIEGDEMCSLCHEPFEQFFDEDEEVWKLKDAVRFNRRTFHPGCYEDAKDAALLDTPTPGEEGLNSSFDMTASPLSAFSQKGASVLPQSQSAEQSASLKDNNNKRSSPTAQKPSEPQAEDVKNEVESDVNSSVTPLQCTDQSVDPPRDSQTPPSVPAAKELEPTSTEKSEDPQNDSSASTTQSVDSQVKSEPSVDSSVVKMETCPTNDNETSTATEADQPMDTSIVAEPSVTVKEEPADISEVNTELLADPEVKMEVDTSAIGVDDQPLSSAVEEKMEVGDPERVAPDTAMPTPLPEVDTTLQSVSSTETVKQESLPETTAEAASETTAPVEAKPEESEQGPTEPSSDPTPAVTVPVKDEEEPPVPSAESESVQTEISEAQHPETATADLESSEVEPPCETPPSDAQAEASTEAQPTPAEETPISENPTPTPETTPSQSGTETLTPSQTEASTDNQDSVDTVTKPESESQTETNTQPLTNPPAVAEVQNIQAISVIGRARVDQRRRDMFFR